MSMKRYGKSVAQQVQYYEVENIYQYMVDTYLNSNLNHFKRLHTELCCEAKREFIEYCFSEVNPHYLIEILKATIK